jgi:hypothetical protein
MKPREQIEKIVNSMPDSFAREKFLLQGIAILCETIEDGSTRIAAAVLDNRENG